MSMFICMCAQGSAGWEELLHALLMSSVVRVMLSLSAAPSSLAPLEPTLFSAACGAHATWARRACVACAWQRAAGFPARVSLSWCRRVRGVTARTAEVQRGDFLVSPQRGDQLLGPLRTDVIACGTRGARAVGVARA